MEITVYGTRLIGRQTPVLASVIAITVEITLYKAELP